MTYDLKPCPFCKSTSVHTFSGVKDNGESKLGVQCWECGAEISRWFPWVADDERQKSLLETVARWNNRATTTYDTPDDLLKSLRAKWCGYHGLDESHLVNPDGPEAADRIEAQAAEIERLREALEQITDIEPDADNMGRFHDIAHAALGETK